MTFAMRYQTTYLAMHSLLKISSVLNDRKRDNSHKRRRPYVILNAKSIYMYRIGSTYISHRACRRTNGRVSSRTYYARDVLTNNHTSDNYYDTVVIEMLHLIIVDTRYTRVVETHRSFNEQV